MDRFLIETPHREQDSLNLIQLLHAQGYLTHFDWGCMNGLHTGWAMIEADNEVEARLAVPPLVRAQELFPRKSEHSAEQVKTLQTKSRRENKHDTP